MKIADFSKLKIENSSVYNRIQIKLELEHLLDTKYTDFVAMLNLKMKNELNKIDFSALDEDLIIEFKTDLPRMELAPLVDLISSSFVINFIKDRNTLKHGEKRLGVPSELKYILISNINLMDLVNRPLLKERFTLEYYDSKNRLLRSFIDDKTN